MSDPGKACLALLWIPLSILCELWICGERMVEAVRYSWREYGERF